MNINYTESDQLAKFIETSINSIDTPVEVNVAMKEVFQFLKWRLDTGKHRMNEEDINIIDFNNAEKFFDLTPASCSYTKGIMTEYTEFLWKKVTTNIYQGNGHTVLPVPDCTPLAMPMNISRKTEVLVMSNLYENNLMNNFLYQRSLTESPLCPLCNTDVQTAYHAMVQCGAVSVTEKDNIRNSLITALGEEKAMVESSITLLNASRCSKFIENYEFRCEIELHPE